MKSNRTSVLFVCTHNSARSQMAEGLLRAFHGDRFEAFSAGTEPTTVHPMAVKAMAELGIDISRARSKSLDEFRGRQLDYVVTVCDRAHQNCPFFAGGRHHLHKGIGDPAQAGLTGEELLPAFRRTRDQLREWIEKELVPSADGGGGPALSGADASTPASGWKFFRTGDHGD